MRITASDNQAWAAAKVDYADAFAEVFPEDKFDIVGVCQKAGHIVGMTGDGVNDCPALRKADIGIAVEGSADAARIAADIVLTRSDMTVLSDAVLVSRMIFDRLRNYIFYRINCTITILAWTFFAEVWAGFTFPPLVYVIMAGFNNVTIISIAFDHIVPEKHPMRWEFRDILPTGITQAILSVIEVFVCFSLANNGLLLFSLFLTPGQIRTIVFMNLCLSMQADTLIMRCRVFFFSPKAPRPGFWPLGSIVGLSLIGLILCVYWPFGAALEPIGWNDAGMVLIIILMFMLMKDVTKVLVYFIADELLPRDVGKLEPKLRIKTLAANSAEFEMVEMEEVGDDPSQINSILIRN